MEKPKLSIITPVRNEGLSVANPLFTEAIQKEVEWILIDTSPTPIPWLSTQHPLARVYHCPDLLYRSSAMNKGAKEARGDIFLFLHLDCVVQAQDLSFLLNDTLPPFDGGAFLKSYSGKTKSVLLTIQERFLNGLVKTSFRFVVGTNGIFCTRKTFEQLGGFREVPFLEDVEFADRIRKECAWVVFPQKIKVSSRKYIKEGTCRRFARNLVLYLLYRVGFSPESLSKWY